MPATVLQHASSADAQSDTSESEILTIGEVAKLLRIGRRSVYDMSRAGRLPAIKIGGNGADRLI
jgi:excisionase family DNA binding protein